MSKIEFRIGTKEDFSDVFKLYGEVASIEGGIARTKNEITPEYVEHWMESSTQRGLWAVGAHEGIVIASLHAYHPKPLVFSHVLSDLTLAISPHFQGQGLGKRLFTYFLNEACTKFPNTQRVELMVRESNVRAQKLYLSLGFKIEGRLEQRVKSVGEGYEADLCMAWLRRAM